MFMTETELYDLTGYKSPSAQVRWLKAHAWKFVLTCTGKPRVSRTYCEQKLGVKRADAEDDQPNWNALNGTTT